MYKGQTLLKEERYNQAIEFPTEAIRLVPDYTKALNVLGDTHLSMLHLYQRALRHFETALSWDPANIRALFGGGVALHFLERYHYCPVELFRHRSNMITINRLEEY